MVKRWWEGFVEALLYPFVYWKNQSSLIRRLEQDHYFETFRELQLLQNTQQTYTKELLSEVLQKSNESSEVLKSWLDGFKRVEVPTAQQFSTPTDEELEGLKQEYRQVNPDTEKLAKMTEELLKDFSFDQ